MDYIDDPLFSTGGSFMLGMLIDNAIELYIRWKSVYSPSASKRYKTRLDKLFSSLPSVCELGELSGDDIVRFHKNMEAEHYSRATVAYSLIITKNFLQFWKDKGEKVPDPKEIKAIKFTNRIKPVVSELDFQKLSSAFDASYFMQLKMKLSIHMLWDTGMRVSELIDLNVSDINDENEKGIRTAQILSKKSSRYNLVAWSRETNILLSKYLRMRAEENIDSEALFVNTFTKRTRRLDVRTIQRWVKHGTKMAGLAKAISPHSFRHGKAHHMLNNGANIRDVQAVLRHVNPVTTFHYLSLNEKQFIEVAGKHLR
jgi:site-specific recombinase XerD